MATYLEQVERHFAPLRDELLIRGIEDARVENSGGGVMVVTGTLPNGWRLDATADGFSFSDADGNTVMWAAYAVQPDGSTAYDALAIEPADPTCCAECAAGGLYAGTINEDSAAYAAHIVLATFGNVAP